MRLRRLLLFVLAISLSACSQEQTASTGTVDTREPVGIWYVGAPELPVYEKADTASPVIATYQNGEAISVLTQKGEWAEVRSGDRAGWAHMADLTTAAGKTESDENPQPKFKVVPMPVSAPGAHGEIYLEADVNSDGEILAVRLLSNTTGSEALASQNIAALKHAGFYPIVHKGERQAFKYYHRVTY